MNFSRVEKNEAAATPRSSTASSEPFFSPAPMGLVQRQEAESEETPAGSSASATVPAGLTCQPQGLTRADFLSRNGNDPTEFGHTFFRADRTLLQPDTLQFQSVGRSGNKQFLPMQVNLPGADSIYTAAGNFIEGSQRVRFDEDGDCLTDTYDLRWFISSDGADKIRAGEQEHCDDYNLAYAQSVLPLATAVNALAASGRTFSSERAARRHLRRQIGFDPDVWFERFDCLIQKSLERDATPRGFTRSSHEPIPFTSPPSRHNRCAYASVFIRGSSLPQIGTIPSASLITTSGCPG